MGQSPEGNENLKISHNLKKKDSCFLVINSIIPFLLLLQLYGFNIVTQIDYGVVLYICFLSEIKICLVYMIR